MRVIYWNTSCLEPAYEAISKEVFQLARRFQPSFIFSINQQFTFRCSWSGQYVGFHPNFDTFLRILIPLVARAGDIHHLYSELCPWIFYKALKNVNPLILTVASEKGAMNQDFLDRCQRIIVQTETLREKLISYGIENSKVVVLYPSVEESCFSISSSPYNLKEAPRILFATAPRSKEEMEGRGVNLLFEAAKLTQDFDLTLLYRPWTTGYTSLIPTQQLLVAHPFPNISFSNRQISDMSEIYRKHHFTIIPYTRSDGGKECPNSVVEGLACGLPAIISSACPFAYFIEKHQCGVVFEPTGSNLIKAIEDGVRKYPLLSKNASNIAQQYFSQEAVFQKLERIYQEL